MIGVGLEIWDEQTPQVLESNNSRGKKDLHTTKVTPDSYAQFVNALRYSQDISQDNAPDSESQYRNQRQTQPPNQRQEQGVAPQPPIQRQIHPQNQQQGVAPQQQIRYQNGVAPQLHQGVSQGVAPQFHQGVSQGVAPQFHQGVSQGVAPQFHQGVSQGVAQQSNSEQIGFSPIHQFGFSPAMEEDSVSNSSSLGSRRRKAFSQKIKNNLNFKNLISEVKVLKQINTLLIIFLAILILILCFKK
jgi:hypothetical protein